MVDYNDIMSFSKGGTSYLARCRGLLALGGGLRVPYQQLHRARYAVPPEQKFMVLNTIRRNKEKGVPFPPGKMSKTSCGCSQDCVFLGLWKDRFSLSESMLNISNLLMVKLCMVVA